MNPTSFNASFIRIPLLSIALIALTNTAIAGGFFAKNLLLQNTLACLYSVLG
jgi:hypothetical protein